MNGWVNVPLLLVANTGAIMIAPRAFGGDLAVQTATGTLVAMTTLGLGLAIYNIKRLQVDQYRAWMLNELMENLDFFSFWKLEFSTLVENYLGLGDVQRFLHGERSLIRVRSP
jgi:hypothetical protein